MKTPHFFFCSAAVCLASFHSVSSQPLAVDPLRRFSKFYEFGIEVNQTRVNTNYTEFNTNQGANTFRKNTYSTGIGAGFNLGWLIKDNDKTSIWSVKSGLHVQNRVASLSNAAGTPLRLSTAFLQLPVMLGFRMPLKYNSSQNKLFKAVEINGGLYTESPLVQKLDRPENLDSPANKVAFDYLRLGFIGEIVFTALNQNGHSHRFGIRTTSDFTPIIKFRETDSQLYPYFISAGMFYMLSNQYKNSR